MDNKIPAHREDVLLEDIDLLEFFGRVRSDGLSKLNYNLNEKKSIICLSKARPTLPMRQTLILIYFAICVSIHKH
jgi:hypothetical protein